MAATRWIRIVPLVAMLLPAVAGAKTWVLPHVFETSGTTSGANAFDSWFYFTYPAGLGGTPSGAGATVNLYLYDNDGTVMEGSPGAPVCAPCTYALSDVNRKVAARVEDRIIAAGGFVGSLARTGFAIVDVTGPGVDDVAVEHLYNHSHTGPFDLEIFSIPTWSCGTAAAQVWPHWIERDGSLGATFTFDTQFYFVYDGGLAGLPDPGAATVDLYLFDTSGLPTTSGIGTPVCNPCSYVVDAATRKVTPRIDDLIVAAGGFGTSVKTGFSLITVSGAGADRVSVAGAITNIKSSVFDLSVFGFDPQPIAAGATLAIEGTDTAGAAGDLRITPNPAARGLRFAFELAREDNVTLAVFDVAGREMARVHSGRLAAGRHDLRWDGAGLDGVPLRAGVYYARLNGADGARMSRLVLVR